MFPERLNPTPSTWKLALPPAAGDLVRQAQADDPYHDQAQASRHDRRQLPKRHHLRTIYQSIALALLATMIERVPVPLLAALSC